MAEIGIAASFISVIAVGTTVATTLYEAADVMVNAKPQMTALAKHVSQSTVLLKHLKDVLKTEMKDSDQIQDLTEEIKLLKTFIMENHNNLADLRQAEDVTAAETAYRPAEDRGNRPADAKSSSPSDLPNPLDPPISPSHSRSLTAFESIDDVFQHGQKDSVGRGETNEVNETDGTKVQHPDDTAGAEVQPISKSPVPPQTINDTSHTHIHRESDLLLQMIPYRPNFLRPLRSDYLLTDGELPDSRPESTTKETTKSIRLLLDRWTTA
ncbi:MAG: hypothetical protein Q9183_006871, partial [Haloplaca sp. 2 TL-2023]